MKVKRNRIYLSHVTDGETSQRWVIGESLNTHWLGGNHLDNGGITRLDEFGGIFDGFTGTTIDLLQELRELAGNVGGVAVEHWCVTGTNLARVVENNDLGVEGVGPLGRVRLGVTSNVTTTNLLDGDVLDVEADVVSWKTLDKLLVVHLDGLDFSSDVCRGEGHDLGTQRSVKSNSRGSGSAYHASLDDTSLNTSDRNRANTTNLVNILEGKTKGLVGRTGWGVDGVDGLQKSLASGLGLGLLLPPLVPRAVGRIIDHVVTVEARNRDERNRLRVVADLLDEVGGFLDNLVVTVAGPLGSVHLVDGNNELLDTKGVGKEGVLASLSILGDTSFEFTSTGSDNEDSAVGLGGTSNHVFDKVTMTRGICRRPSVLIPIWRGIVVSCTNDGDVVLGSLEFP